jgi:DnaD/phage-associated family protein
MKAFSGFPAGTRAVRLPAPFFTDLLPAIDGLDELKVTLHVFYRLGEQQGEARYVRHREALADPLLLEGIGPAGAIEAALERAVERGTLLRAEAEIEGGREMVYFANTQLGRATLEALRRGEPLSASSLPTRPTIFALYEENVGPLTPLIAEELEEAEDAYPAEWIETAFREAVTLNKRSWKYIRAILERWRVEGRGEAKSAAPGERRRDIDGPYGEYIKR